MVIINAQVTKNIRPRLSGTWDKALEFYRFSTSAKIPLRLVYHISHSPIGTYHGLRSGSNSNLKRWRLITESSCFLCGKSICTSAHILGACKIALHQGRFSFRHDKVLCEILVILKNFSSSYKPNKSCYQFHQLC